MDEMMMKKMMGKKDEGKMSEQEIQAKMDVVQELLHMAQEAMGNRVKSGMDDMQKVSVAAPDKESLLAGLDMAQEVAEDAPVADAMEDSEKPVDESPEASEDSEESMPMDMPAEEEESSPFGKMKSKPAKKKLFSMED